MAMWHEVKSIMISTYDARQRACWLVVCLPHIAVVVVFGFVKKNVPLIQYFLFIKCLLCFCIPHNGSRSCLLPPAPVLFCWTLASWHWETYIHVLLCTYMCSHSTNDSSKWAQGVRRQRTNQVGSNKQQVPDDYLRTLSGGHIIINNHYYLQQQYLWLRHIITPCSWECFVDCRENLILHGGVSSASWWGQAVLAVRT